MAHVVVSVVVDVVVCGKPGGWGGERRRGRGGSFFQEGRGLPSGEGGREVPGGGGLAVWRGEGGVEAPQAPQAPPGLLGQRLLALHHLPCSKQDISCPYVGAESGESVT